VLFHERRETGLVRQRLRPKQRGGGHRVLAFRRDADGTLTQVGSFSTGGAGSGTPHLQSQGSVVLAGGGSHLLVAKCRQRSAKRLCDG
jgi:hypothetical protein